MPSLQIIPPASWRVLSEYNSFEPTAPTRSVEVNISIAMLTIPFESGCRYLEKLDILHATLAALLQDLRKPILSGLLTILTPSSELINSAESFELSSTRMISTVMWFSGLTPRPLSKAKLIVSAHKGIMIEHKGLSCFLNESFSYEKMPEGGNNTYRGTCFFVCRENPIVAFHEAFLVLQAKVLSINFILWEKESIWSINSIFSLPGIMVLSKEINNFERALDLKPSLKPAKNFELTSFLHKNSKSFDKLPFVKLATDSCELWILKEESVWFTNETLPTLIKRNQRSRSNWEKFGSNQHTGKLFCKWVCSKVLRFC